MRARGRLRALDDRRVSTLGSTAIQSRRLSTPQRRRRKKRSGRKLLGWKHWEAQKARVITTRSTHRGRNLVQMIRLDGIEGFMAWFQKHEDGLRHELAAVVADQLGDEVLRVNQRLGVEVADDR